MPARSPLYVSHLEEVVKHLEEASRYASLGMVESRRVAETVDLVTGHEMAQAVGYLRSRIDSVLGQAVDELTDAASKAGR